MAPPGRNRRGGGKRSRAANRQESTQTPGSTIARPESSQAGGTQTDEAISKAVNVLRVTREANRSITQACEWLKTQGISDEQLHQALVQLRDPISKTFKCETCETNSSSSHFSAKVNFERHITKHASASHSKIVSRDEVLSHWQHLSAENKASMISVVEAKIEAGFGHSVADILQMTGMSRDSSYLPHELMISADRLAIIGTAWASENSEFHLLEFLDACSEGTILCSDINKFVPPLYLPRLRNLETELTEMFAYYSCYLETELVQSLIILNEGLAKVLIKNEEEELLKKERLKQQTERGKTVQNLPPAAESSEVAATSGDAAEATTSELVIDFSSVRERFLDILRRFRFSKSKSVTPYFRRQLESMCLFGDLHMPIFYWIVKQQDKGLALIIRDHEKRVHKSLQSALKQFIHDTGYAHRLSINKIELEIVDCPPPRT